MIKSIDVAAPMRERLAALDVTSSYRELIKSSERPLDAQVEQELIQPYINAIAEVEGPGTVVGLEQALMQLAEVT